MQLRASMSDRTHTMIN